MHVWRDLSISSKIVAAFTLVFATAVGLGLFGLSQAASINGKAADIRDNWLPSTVLLGKLTSAVKEFRIKEASVVIAAEDKGSGALADDAAAFREAQAAVEKAYTEYQPLITLGTSDEQYMRTFVGEWTKLRTSSAEVIDKAAYDDVAGMLVLYSGQDKANFDAVVTAVSADLEFNGAEGKKAADAGTATYQSSRLLMTAALIISGLLSAGAGLALIAGIARPIRDTTATVDRLAMGDLEVAVEGAERKDEVGLLARALDVFKRNAIEARQRSAQQDAERVAKEARATHLADIVAGFETKIGAVVGSLSSGSTGLEATARSMTSTADRTNQQAAFVASASEEATAGVQTAAAAAEELSVSIQEITRQVAQSANVTGKAVADAQRTDTIVSALADGADKIGQVVGLITTIAGQTNLLALNATIEAARAGDAGKGFAVVASEVKNLANQTAKATEEIGSQISQIQGATKEAVTAIRDIVTTITEVSAISTSIASAVEEQGAATAEIARNVQQTAHAAKDVTSNITGVTQAANDAGTAATQVLGAAGDLSRQAEELAAQVNAFLSDVRAA
jgi:methyl-accepting chemotaxis protein